MQIFKYGSPWHKKNDMSSTPQCQNLYRVTEQDNHNRHLYSKREEMEGAYPLLIHSNYKAQLGTFSQLLIKLSPAPLQ